MDELTSKFALLAEDLLHEKGLSFQVERKPRRSFLESIQSGGSGMTHAIVKLQLGWPGSDGTTKSRLRSRKYEKLQHPCKRQSKTPVHPVVCCSFHVRCRRRHFITSTRNKGGALPIEMPY